MEFSIINILMAVGAGVASVLSPCVLPVIPVIMAGSERNDRLRPLLVVSGLSLSFMTMGAISSLFGALLIGKTRSIEIAGALIIIILGLMVMLDLSIFKRFYRLSNIRVTGEGRVGGLILGMALGLIWVPCVGPFLSTTLTMVATSGQLTTGIILLGFYSLGLALPMLIVGYSSQLLQNRIKGMLKHETILRYASGGTLVAFGLYSIIAGNMAF
ncbi:MAG: cytochrome c biogenesis CcdA family protein [Desulfuromonadaceae bacterium]|nr:cytochrome c biogenesis CcdA family protein [Desulfuromonadaceae bacterium]MDD2847679.1 cytochrome c biogenesis CcdA family protein [Desulfuromonadaceae bacterium]MDD4131075.1 cytochrome c biogenesis CcdA family protein [Desulfuromonadaceae bacterium]